MSEQLPIKEIFSRAIRMPLERYSEIIRLGWPYGFLVLVSSFMPEEVESIGLSLVYGTLFFLTSVLGIVGCHRVFLLPADAVEETATARWSPRETKFALCLVGLGLITCLIALPLFFLVLDLGDAEYLDSVDSEVIIDLLFTIVLMPVYYFISRLSLILPDSAVDNDRTFSWAWNISSGRSYRLFVLVGAIPLITTFVLGFLTALLEPSYIFNLIQNIVWLIVAVIEICLLSLSYEWIVAKSESENYS